MANVEFEIEEGFDPPTKRSSHNAKYPFEEMGIGKSFFVPAENEKDVGVIANRIQNRVSRANSALKPKAFVWERRVNVKGEKAAFGVRVWRVEDVKDSDETGDGKNS